MELFILWTLALPALLAFVTLKIFNWCFPSMTDSSVIVSVVAVVVLLGLASTFIYFPGTSANFESFFWWVLEVVVQALGGLLASTATVVVSQKYLRK
jgi:hypothetical protein